MEAELIPVYSVTVSCFDMTPDALDALFDRVADAAHALDEQVSCSGAPEDPFADADELARLRREIEAACGPIPAVDEDGDPVTYYVLATKLRRILGTQGGNA